MPHADVYFFLAGDGTVPVFDWLQQLRRRDRRAYAKCTIRIQHPDDHIWEETDGQKDA